MSKTILHADDSASVRRWVAEQLSDLDVKVVSVADGEAALQVLQGVALRPAADRPGDAQPRRPGLVAAVRELPMYRFLPVLILSSRQPTEFDPERRQGVTGWIVKPIEPEHLRRWVRRVLPR